MDKIAPTSRRAFSHQGRVIYEWDQTVEEVNVYIKVPPGARARDLDVKITSKALRVGIVNTPPYLEHDFEHGIKADDSVWTLDDGELHFSLAKTIRGKAWTAPFSAHATARETPENDADAKRLMLDRFQMENPGFDFSDAAFNGSNAPDASTFMGGMG